MSRCSRLSPNVLYHLAVKRRASVADAGLKHPVSDENEVQPCNCTLVKEGSLITQLNVAPVIKQQKVLVVLQSEVGG